MRAQLKFQEQDRLETLRGFGVLDTLEEQSFDDITALTAEICDIPVCLVSFVDENRQWFKSKIGLDICETPFDQSICAHALVQDDYLEIADTEQDVRTVDNPLCMGKKSFRFYAGAILRTNAGVLLGTLCVLDYHPRSLTSLQQKVLKIHATHVVKLLELRVTLETEKTLRLQAQEQQVALAESEDRLDAILTAAPCGILSVDEDGVIHSANNAISKISGYAQSELVGQNIELLAYDMIQDSAIISSRKDGSQVPVEIGLNRTKLQDGSNQIVATVVDITARVKAEEERDHLISRLTDSNKELERFAFVCSHDMQEPLRMIRALSERLQTHIASTLDGDEKSQRYLTLLMDGAERAQNLITGVLAYSSLDQTTSETENINLRQLVESIQNVMSKNLEDCGGKITFNDLPTVNGNKTQLYQLFQNLIINGLKYQGLGSEPHVHIEAEDAGTDWHFSIIDNGIGIDSRHIDKIFEVFQRLHRRAEYSGTGIGLSICKKIVEHHNGEIWVESEKEKGSTFKFTFPKLEKTSLYIV
jgi:signal transduction histidine kinase